MTRFLQDKNFYLELGMSPCARLLNTELTECAKGTPPTAIHSVVKAHFDSSSLKSTHTPFNHDEIARLLAVSTQYFGGDNGTAVTSMLKSPSSEFPLGLLGLLARKT